MKILGIDIETTGLDLEQERVTEIGYTLYDTDSQQPVSIFSELVNEDPHISEENRELTGISRELVDQFGRSPVRSAKRLVEAMKGADYLLAHNAMYEVNFLQAFFDRHEIEMNTKKLKWICSQTDPIYPASCRSKALIYLTSFFGFVNPFQHRAVTDALSAILVVEKSGNDWEELAEKAEYPIVRLEVEIGFDHKDLPKAAGFYWHPERKVWWKNVREDMVDTFLEDWERETGKDIEYSFEPWKYESY